MLGVGDYFTTRYTKNKIILHHTAGSHRPDSTIQWWSNDGTKGVKRAVATAFVVGGISTKNDDKSFDGVVYRAFPEEYWAYHLGLKTTHIIDKESIGIEICNYGACKLDSVGRFVNAYGGFVPENQIVELDKDFRGTKYYQAYTEKQMESVRKIIIMLLGRFEIDNNYGLKYWLSKENLKTPSNLKSIKERQNWLNQNGFCGEDGEPIRVDGVHGRNTQYALESVGQSAFDKKSDALEGKSGIWTHTNYRSDKSDCSPQPILIQMINSI